MSSKGRTTTLLGSVAIFLIALELTIISVALPEMEAEFADASRATLSWVFTAYNVGVASLLLVFGWAAERAGRKRLFLFGLAVFTVGSVASGLSPDIGTLIASRVVQAIGGAMLVPASLGLVLAANEASERDVAIGVWGSMAGLAAAVGPSIGAVLADVAGWRWVFLVNVPIALLAIVIGARSLDESMDENMPAKVDLVAVPAGSLAVGLLVFIIVAAEALGWANPVTIGLFVLSAVLGTVFVRRSVNHPAPLFDPSIARRSSFRVSSVATLCFVAGFTGWLVLAPTFLTEIWDYSVLRAGFAIAPGPLAMAIAAGPAGKVAARRGYGPVVSVGAVLGAAAIAWWVVAVGESPAYLTAFLPGALLLGVGVGAGFPMLTAAAMAEVPAHQYAMGAAGNTTIRQLAMALGIAAAIAIVGPPADAGSELGPFVASWVACGVLFLVTALVMTRFPTLEPSGAEPLDLRTKPEADSKVATYDY